MMIETAFKAAKESGKIVMGYYGKDKLISNKGAVDLVTEVDMLSEKKIVEIIKKKYPNHGFILEESDSTDTDAEYVWIIDPIDGTTSFAHNYPLFSISIALMKNKELVLGVVLIPYMHERFYAERGRGAFLNDRPIKVSKTETLSKSLVATGFPYTRITSNIDNLNYFGKVAKVAQGLRRSGSAALDICYVAAGRMDAYWELGLKIMDTAAAQLILKEAGGKVTDFEGNPIKEDFSKVVATNGIVHDELLKKLKEAE